MAFHCCVLHPSRHLGKSGLQLHSTGFRSPASAQGGRIDGVFVWDSSQADCPRSRQ